MTYFGFLFMFVILPMGVLMALNYFDRRPLPTDLQNWTPWGAIVTHIVVAVTYTTPWDNYLVATGVWWYDEALVTGYVIGWVPIEEYTFFVVQTVFTGAFLVWLARRVPTASETPLDWGWTRRGQITAGVGVAWVGSVVLLASGWLPGTYLGLQLVWALPPIMLQLFFGVDILWRHRWLVLATLIPATLYLAYADALAIQSGTWTIDPAQSLEFYLGGVLPIEEFLFFMFTNILVVFGITLVLAAESQSRLPHWVKSRLPGLRDTASKKTSHIPVRK